MDSRLCDTRITGNHLAQHLKDSLTPKAILNSVVAEKFAVGQGFVSHLLKVKLTWETEDQLPKTVIVKVTSGETVSDAFDEMGGQKEEEKQNFKEAMLDGVLALHNTECTLYEIFGKSPPIAAPKCYGTCRGTADSPPAIILEDLSETGSVIACLVEGMNLPQVLEAVEAVAKLHGWSLVTTIDWQSRVDDMAKREELFEPFFASIRPGYEAVKKDFPAAFGSIDVDRILELASLKAVVKYGNAHQAYMDDVLAHGDYWANNILFEKQSDGTIGNRLVGVIDFQLSIRTGPMGDVARLLTWSVSQQIRRNHIKEILHHYYDTLKSVAGDKLTATYEQLEENYHYQFSISALHMLAGLPVMVKYMVKSDGDQRKQDEDLFVERMKAAYDDALKTLEKS